MQSTAAKTPTVNESHMDALLGVFAQAQPGSDIASIKVNTVPPMSVAQIEAACAQLGYTLTLEALTSSLHC